MGRTSLYRHFDRDGRLLYVGISKNALARLEGHAGRCWYDEIASVSIERFATRSQALAAEVAAIRAEKPLFNKTHRKPKRPARARAKKPERRPSVARERADHPTKYELAWGRLHELFAGFTPAEIAEIEGWCA